MQPSTSILNWFLFLTAAVSACVVRAPLEARGASGSETVVYRTGFEVEEGYDINFTLAGQNGWVRSGSGGNGILTNFFENFGQQAFIGFSPPEDKEDSFNVWRPINIAPIPAGQPIVRFSVLMQIIDSTSTNGPFDDFRWSVYNTNESRLFTIDFDNSQLLISYGLDDGKGFVSTGYTFDHAGAYELEIFMDFSRNLWTAALNSTVIVNSKPITTTGAALNFGDADAVWALREPGKAGDNYMVFDNYKVATLSPNSIPSTVQVLGFNPAGDRFKVRINGQAGVPYALEASSDLKTWEEIASFIAPSDGVFELEDSEAGAFTQQFYRVRQIP